MSETTPDGTLERDDDLDHRVARLLAAEATWAALRPGLLDEILAQCVTMAR